MTPWQKIMRAYNADGGCRSLRLTADDIEQLGQDGAIETRASNDDIEACERSGHRKRDSDGYCICGTHADPNRMRGALKV